MEAVELSRQTISDIRARTELSPQVALQTFDKPLPIHGRLVLRFSSLKLVLVLTSYLKLKTKSSAMYLSALSADPRIRGVFA